MEVRKSQLLVRAPAPVSASNRCVNLPLGDHFPAHKNLFTMISVRLYKNNNSLMARVTPAGRYKKGCQAGSHLNLTIFDCWPWLYGVGSIALDLVPLFFSGC